MKIALCLSGQLRNVQSTYSWFKSNVFDCNSSHIIDTFVHSWFDKNTIGNVHYAANHIPNSVIACDPIPDNVINQVYDSYNPIVFQLEHQKQFDEKNYNTRKLLDAIPQNGLSRLYSLYKSVKLKNYYEIENNIQYDLVMVTRFDLMLLAPVIFDNFINNGIYHPGNSPHGFNVCCVIGKSSDINVYSKLFNLVDDVFNTGIYWCDELLAIQHCNMQSLAIYDFNIPTKLNRGILCK